VTPRRLTGLAVGIASAALVPFVSLDHFIFVPDRNVPRHRRACWSDNAGNIARAPVLQALVARGLGVHGAEARRHG